MNKIVVLNHKMNLLYSDIYDYIDKLNNIETKEDIIVAPSDLYLIEFTNTCNWGVASQNVYYEEKGGYTGEILIDDNLEWYCPNCGNRDHDKLNVARRTCGYIGTNFWNKGRTQEIKERVIHIDNKDAEE